MTAAAADAHEVADLAAHEPGRVVVAVAAARPVDEDDVGLPELRAPVLDTRGPGLLAQARAPLLLHGCGHGVGAAVFVPGRGE